MRRAITGLGLLVAWSIPGLVSPVATMLLFPDSPTLSAGFATLVAVNTASWWVWAAATPAIVALSRRVAFERHRLAAAVAVHVGAAAACTFAYIAVFTLLVMVTRPASAPHDSFAQLFRGFIAGRLPISLIAYVTIVGVSIAIDERTRRRARELESVRLEGDLARAQLQALQMHLQPHFLFNTLHAIGMLVEENPRAAARMIALLGELLRRTLGLADVPEVTLGEELSLLRSYLQIEEMRFGDRLTTAIDVPEELLDLRVPSFILQPLAENAVRHGVAPRLDHGRLRVSAECRDSRLSLIVEDDGPGFGAPAGDPGVGLAATRERLAVRYRSAASLRCETAAGAGARVTIEIPAERG